MKDFVNKMLNVMGFDNSEEDEEEEVLPVEKKQKISNVSMVHPHQSSGKKSKVVDINTTTQFQVMIMVVEKFEDTMYIADHLKARKPVVVNVEGIKDEQEIQRIIDFIGGVIYAIEGEMQKISKGILLVTPFNVKIMGDIKTELLSNSSFPWLNN